MNDKQFEALIKALERIAAALEQANICEMYPPQVVVTTPPSYPAGAPQPLGHGYSCGRCGRWVGPGQYHACSGAPTTLNYCSLCGVYYAGSFHACNAAR